LLDQVPPANTPLLGAGVQLTHFVQLVVAGGGEQLLFGLHALSYFPHGLSEVFQYFGKALWGEHFLPEVNDGEAHGVRRVVGPTFVKGQEHGPERDGRGLRGHARGLKEPVIRVAGTSMK